MRRTKKSRGDGPPVADPVASAEEDLRRERLAASVQHALGTGDYASAFGAAEAALDLAAQSGDLRGQAFALYQRGLIHQQREETAPWVDTLSRCVELSEATGDRRLAARALIDLGKASLLRNEDRVGREHLRRAVDICRAVGDRIGEAQALNNLANLDKLVGDIASSLEKYQAALEIYEAADEKLLLAQVLLNIANTYNVLEDPRVALTHADRGLALFESGVGGAYHRAVTLNIIGTSYAKLGQHETAVAYFRRSIALAEPLNTLSLAAFGYADVGDSLIALGRFDEAEEALERSLGINRQQNYLRAHAECLARLGRLYASESFPGRDDETAARYLEEARVAAEGLDSPSILVPVYEALAGLRERRGEFPEAITALRRGFEMERRLFNDRSDQRIRAIEGRAASERARRDAEIARLRNVELAAALAEAERLRQLENRRALTDELTGLANRRHLRERLTAEWKRARRWGRTLSLAVADIDHFKRINDRFGHEVGDRTLRRVAHLMRDLMQDTCPVPAASARRIAARSGGEEFVLLLPDTEADAAHALCERIRARIADEDWSTVAEGLTVTISIGIATAAGRRQTVQTPPSPRPGMAIPGASVDDTASLLRLADLRLYEAKNSGRNRVARGCDQREGGSG